MANKQRNTRVVTVGDTAKIENDLRKLNIGPFELRRRLGRPQRCFGKGEEAEALIRQRNGTGIVEDEIKAYLLCIDCAELLAGTASRRCFDILRRSLELVL